MLQSLQFPSVVLAWMHYAQEDSLIAGWTKDLRSINMKVNHIHKARDIVGAIIVEIMMDCVWT